MDSVRRLSLQEFVLLFASLISLTALAIDIVLPAYPQLAQHFNADIQQDVPRVVTLFIFGMVFGELLFGPLSDAFGRKSAIVSGLFIFVLGSLVCMMATSLEWLWLGRILQGIGVSGPKIGSRALIRDQYQGDAMARVMSQMMIIFILVPMVAPAIGQALLWVVPWQGLFVVLLVQAISAGTWLILRQPETLQPEKRIAFSLTNWWQSTQLFLRDFPVMAYTAVAGFTFGGQLIYLSLCQNIFFDVYGVSEWFPVYFAALAFAIGLASLVNSFLVMKLGMAVLALTSQGLLLLTSSLLLIWTVLFQVPGLFTFMIIAFVMLFCVGLLFGNINALAMQSLGRIAGVGASLIAAISSALAVLVSSLVGGFYQGSLVPLAFGFFLCSTVSLLLLWLANKRPVKEL